MTKVEPSGPSPQLLSLTVLPERLTICRFDPQAAIPDWATIAPFFSVTRTLDELSIVCCEGHVPAGVTGDRGWRALKLNGPFDFALVGILSAVAAPLAAASISIFAIATYDTDYVLVRETHLDQAIAVLTAQGHRVT